ncbi:cyclic nucleotide-binding domain-containing protein [Candidatus Latescibacterota bacterium]
MDTHIRRVGIDRRISIIKKKHEQRNKFDRRGLVKSPGRTIESMKKLPIFQGLYDDDYKKLILICSKRLIPKDVILCHKGEESLELYILLKGQLKVMLSPSSFLTYISPIGLVGEIGIFTGAERTATVMASTESTVIRIYKRELFELFNKNTALSNRILMNVIADLANKLQEDNDMIEELRTKKRTKIL